MAPELRGKRRVPEPDQSNGPTPPPWGRSDANDADPWERAMGPGEHPEVNRSPPSCGVVFEFCCAAVLCMYLLRWINVF